MTCHLARRCLAVLAVTLLTVAAGLPASAVRQDDAELGPPPVAGNAALVPAGKYPAVALIDIIGRNFTPQCTGTLVAPRWVLTAAHCLADPGGIDEVNLLLGSVDVHADLAQRPLPAGVELHRASGWIVHGDFGLTGDEDDEQAHHDVALIQLPVASALAPIPVSTDAALVEPQPGGTLPAIVVGFGTSDCSPLGCATNDRKLRQGPTIIATDTDANALAPQALSLRELAYNIFMTPDPANHAALCFGDSGGPILVTQDGQPRVAGVNSFSLSLTQPCGGPEAVDAAADVTGSALADWVRQVIDPPHTTCDGRAPTLEGTTYRDVITGSTGTDIIHGRGGADTIDGRPGHDTICGGKAADHLRGGPGRDTINGDTGNDTIRGNGSGDTLHGGNGRDKIFGGTGRDLLRGGEGNDTIRGRSGNDELRGGKGIDTCRGGPGTDVAVSCELRT